MRASRADDEDRRQPSRTACCKIITTDTRCRFSGSVRPGIPVLIWPDGIDVLPSDYLRQLVAHQDVQPNSAEEYAKVLRLFGAHLRAHGKTWEQADDTLLLNWRSSIEGRGIGEDRVAYCLSTVFAFYRWAETSRALQHVVGLPLPDRPGARNPIGTYPISAKQSPKGHWTGRVRGQGRSRSYARKHTPTQDEVRSLHSLLSEERRTRQRDALLLKYPDKTGCRIFEMLQLRVKDLPPFELLPQLLGEDRPWLIEIARKNARRNGMPTSVLIVGIQLAWDSWDYFFGERQDIVDDMRRRDPAWAEPQMLFLSSTTGRPLRPDSVTHIGCELFARAGIKRASIHRLRARFIVRTIEHIIAMLEKRSAGIGPIGDWKNTVLVKAATMAGNKSWRSLEPYVNDELSRRDRNPLLSDPPGDELPHLERRQAALAAKLKTDEKLSPIYDLLAGDDPMAAAIALNRLAESLRRQAKTLVIDDDCENAVSEDPGQKPL